MLTFGAQAGLPWATCATRPLRSLGTCHLSHCKIIGWAVYANKSKNRTRGHSKREKNVFFFKILPSSAHMRNKKHRRCWRGLYRGCSVSLQPLLTWNVAPVPREPLKNAEVAPLKRAKLERHFGWGLYSFYRENVQFSTFQLISALLRLIWHHVRRKRINRLSRRDVFQIVMFVPFWDHS